MLVHLRSYHRKSKKFKHPVVENCKPITKDDAELLATALFNDRAKNKDAFVNGMMSAIRHLVGRYLAAWPETKRYTDEMVAEGLLSVVRTANTLTKEILDGRPVLKVVTSRAQSAIEAALYKLGSVTAPAKATRDRNAAVGKSSPYRVAETDLSKVDLFDNTTQEEKDLFDANDALEVMAKRLQLDVDLLKPEYRDLTSEEVAALLNVPQWTVRRRRARLRSIYHIEFGG